MDNESSVNCSEGGRNEIDKMPRTDFELIQHAEEKQKRRGELEINRFALYESTAKLENENLEFLKRCCESDEAKINVENQRLQNDSIRQRNEEKCLELDIERHNTEKKQRYEMLNLMGALIRKTIEMKIVW
jgi:hypothetical protein